MSDRRETMLVELTAAMRRIHARRRMGRRIAAAAALCLVAAIVWTISARPPAPIGTTGAANRGVVTVVGPGQRTNLIRIMDDQGLIERLREIDRPAGLIRTEGRARISERVTDVELGTS